MDTYVGTSGRVFPRDRKAAPLLRGWVRRLRESGVEIHVQHRWLGWDANGALRLATPGGEILARADAVVLALGGASWPQLGSDGGWTPALAAAGADIAPLRPANCGFDIDWSGHFADRFAGAPLKPVVARWRGTDGEMYERQGECVATATGIEGSLVYGAGADLRAAIDRDGARRGWNSTWSPAATASACTATWHGRATGAASASTCAATPGSRRSRRRCCSRYSVARPVATSMPWPPRSRPCPCCCAGRARSPKRSAPPAACAWNRWMAR